MPGGWHIHRANEQPHHLEAGVPTMRTLVYMSHPVAGAWRENIHNANLWYRFLRSLSPSGVVLLLKGPDGAGNPAWERRQVAIQKVSTMVEANRPREREPLHVLARPYAEPPVVIAPWLCCPVPDNEYPGGRARAIDDCLAVVRFADELWHVGACVSGGMRGEEAEARFVRDLTSWGAVPPMWEDTGLFI